MKDKLLILGGNGFVGKHFQRFLSQYHSSDFEVVVVDRQKTENGIFRELQSDLLIENQLEDLLSQETPDYIINLAGVNRSDSADVLFKANALLPLNLLSLLVKHQEIKIKKILLIGSAAEYGSNDSLPLSEDADLLPINEYGFSKVIQTQVAKYYNIIHALPVCVARTFNIVGDTMPPAMAIGSFAAQVKNQPDGGVVNVGFIESKRDYLDIDDICRAFISILSEGQSGEIYNVCSGGSISMKQILEKMISASGKRLSIQCQTTPSSSEIITSYGDNSKLKKLGWGMKKDLNDSLSRLVS
jgi:GDP-4-dehydro-6-deoxy-D-mannose reductase